jgi:glycosyltransferase involved in cell wall biosynthesis
MLAIVTTHPIQYQTPIWRALAADARVPFEVWYLTDFGTRPSRDRQFDKTFQWDIDLLSGYPHAFLTTPAAATPVDFWRCRLAENLRARVAAAGVKALWIQGWQVAGYWQAVRQAKAAGAEVWLRAESNDLAPVPLWKQPLKRAALGYLFGHIDRFFAIGSANRRLYQSYGVPESKLLPAPYAVDNARFAAQTDALLGQRVDIRRAWGITDDAFCVLLCGKFITKKRPLDLVAAARQAIASGTKVHLLFAGSGELGNALRAACRVAFDADNLSVASMDAGAPPASFTGFLNQSEISRAYVAADALALPSDTGETWGLVVNEAMASGLPCIVSAACGCAEDLVAPEWRFPLGDSHALAQRIVAMKERGAGAQKTLPTIADTVAAVAQAYAALSAHR